MASKAADKGPGAGSKGGKDVAAAGAAAGAAAPAEAAGPAGADSGDEDELEEEEAKQPLAKTHANESAAMNRVADNAEDREETIDKSQLSKAMDALAAEAKARRAEQVRKDVELARVKVNPDDVKLIMNELDLEDKAADRHLREHNGDVRAALRALVQ